MMPQTNPKFTNFGESVNYFYKKYAAIAPDRFQPYLQYVDGRHLEAIALYRWNLELSEALYPCLHAAELTLRNCVHRAIVHKYKPDKEWWFDLEHNGRALLKGIDQDKVQEAIEKLRKAGKPIVAPRVVAELSFGFWVELLNSNYEPTIVVPMLTSTMKNLKCGLPTQGWLRDNFGKLRDLRNRVSHHEPIFDRDDIVSLNGLAWSLGKELNPALTTTIRQSCRFSEVIAVDHNVYASQLKERIRIELFEKFKS